MPSIDVRKNSKIFIGVGAVILFVLGIVIGRFLLGGGATGSLNGRTTLSEGELNTPIASYTYNGQTKEVTAREVIENTSGLDAAKQSDGTYAVPAADKIIGYVRNALVVAEAITCRPTSRLLMLARLLLHTSSLKTSQRSSSMMLSS